MTARTDLAAAFAAYNSLQQVNSAIAALQAGTAQATSIVLNVGEIPISPPAGSPLYTQLLNYLLGVQTALQNRLTNFGVT